MILLFLENIDTKLKIPLNLEKTKHLKAFRLKKNDIIHITDGSGNIHKCSIFEFNALFGLEIIESKFVEKDKKEIIIAISPTKNKSRFEWFLEKSVEIGVSEIYPILCQRSERKELNINRSDRIIVSAMEQSLSVYKTNLNPMQKFTNFVKEKNHSNKFIAHEKSINSIKDIKSSEFDKNKTIILIGPEGGFTEQELELAKNNRYKPILLSHKRLRTETAAIFSAVAFGLV